MSNPDDELEEMLKRPVAYRPSLAKAVGSIKLALLLSQLYYWSDKGDDPDGWIYKTREELYRELGMSRDEQETARRQGRALGVLEEVKRGLPRKVYYRINKEKLIELLSDYRTTGAAISWRKSTHQVGSIPSDSDEETPPAYYTENTSKITSQTTSPGGYDLYTRKFFEECEVWVSSDHQVVGGLLSGIFEWMKKVSGSVDESEFLAFLSYWQKAPEGNDEKSDSEEPHKGQLRWELEKTFMVRERIDEWMVTRGKWGKL